MVTSMGICHVKPYTFAVGLRQNLSKGQTYVLLLYQGLPAKIEIVNDEGRYAMKTFELNSNTSVDYDEERKMEPRPEPRMEATPTLRLRSPGVRRQRERVVGFEDAPNRERNRRGRNVEGIRPSEIEAREGHQPSTNIGGNLPPKGTLLSHHAQPFIPSSLHIPIGLVPTPINPYSQPPMNLIRGQALNFLFQTQMGNPPTRGASTYQGGYILQAFTNNSVPSYNEPIHPIVTPSSSYPFYAQPMHAPPNMPAYLNLAEPFADSVGDPDNFLHLFEGAIRMQKWLMPIACHMFTYTLKDSARIWWNSQKIGSILNYEDLKAKFRSHFSQQKKFTKTHLAVHNIKQREGESTRAFITRYMDDTLQILGLHEEKTNLRLCSWLGNKKFGRASLHRPSIHLQSFERSKKSSWDNNRGQKNKDRFSPYRGPNHGLLPSLSKSLKEILATEKAGRSFEPPPKMFGIKQSRDTSKYCHFYEDYGHDTNDCRHLRTHIQEVVNSGQLSHLVKGIKKERTKSSDTTRGESKKDKGTTPAEAPILMVSQETHIAKSLTQENTDYEGKDIIFPLVEKVNNALVIIEAKIFGRKVGEYIWIVEALARLFMNTALRNLILPSKPLKWSSRLL
ncbi:reverse transcriptase domain-containing protein [Tanacetum coccineum]